MEAGCTLSAVLHQLGELCGLGAGRNFDAFGGRTAGAVPAAVCEERPPGNFGDLSREPMGWNARIAARERRDRKETDWFPLCSLRSLAANHHRSALSRLRFAQDSRILFHGRAGARLFSGGPNSSVVRKCGFCILSQSQTRNGRYRLTMEWFCWFPV